MTQNGGIDILIAWCTFSVLMIVLGWFVLHGHDDAEMRAHNSDEHDGNDQPDDDGPNSQRPQHTSPK